MPAGQPQPDDERPDDALDLLLGENGAIADLLDRLDATREGTGVEARAEHGDLVKQLIRRVAVREAALVDVARGVETVPGLDDLSAEFEDGMAARRRAIDRVEKMSRGVQGIALNTGQDFEPELVALEEILRREFRWQDAAAARIRGATDAERGGFASASHVAAHAPTNLHPEGPRWWERAPVISRLVTVYDHLRDFPRASSHRAPDGA